MARPASHRTSRFISSPSSPPEVNAAVTSRQNWPDATAKLPIASSWVARPRVMRSSTQTAARIPIST